MIILLSPYMQNVVKSMFGAFPKRPFLFWFSRLKNTGI